MKMYLVWTNGIDNLDEMPVAYLSKSHKDAQQVKDRLNTISKLDYQIATRNVGEVYF